MGAIIINKCLHILETLRQPNGLFIDGKAQAAWLRDNIYHALGLEAIDPAMALRTYHAILDALHEQRVSIADQHAAIGLLLFKVSDLAAKGFAVCRDEHDWKLVQKLVLYLNDIQYWQCKDHGMWISGKNSGQALYQAPYQALHASSLGACVAGLEKIQPFLYVPEGMIAKGRKALHAILPKESAKRKTDLALLSLIFPLRIATEEQAKQILKNVEAELVREHGTLRFPGDAYCRREAEAEWPLGFAWLATIYKMLGNIVKYKFYLEKTFRCLTMDDELPELYYANSSQHNRSVPFGMAHAMLTIALMPYSSETL